jgi:hypothetical protein
MARPFITLEVEPSDKVGDVKAKIRDQQRIIFDGSSMQIAVKTLASSALAAAGPSSGLRVGKIPDTQFPNPNYPNPDPKYPNPKYPIIISDSDCKNPKLVRVIQVMFPGTRTTQITRNISNICSSIPNMKT